ncbi:MAG: glycosyltransferase, partial [Candidatus Marinimicrobia bacterium]|nr:glycosyltransferase [Candidatus Neomarinimicrobiota bacterium]
MAVLHAVLISGFVLYILFTVLFIAGLLRLKKCSASTESIPTVSVVVAARNEQGSLPALLEDLTRQDYPANKISFVIADDRSSDGTWDIIQEKAQADSRFSGVKIEDLNPNMTPKKYALTNAIQQSGGDIILSTDADCRVPDGWAKSMAHALSSENGIVIGLSTVNTDKKSFFNSYQFIDFLGIMAANAGALGWGTGWSGSGQNLGYTRKQFEKIDGFTPVG